MDSSFKFPGSPGTPLHQISPDRVNQQRSSIFDESIDASISRHSRESSVHDKVAVFNSMAFQGKQLERKTNDAALKRAMLGREEAESEMRRYREEVKALRRQVDDGKERERRVGERLEGVMVSILPELDNILLLPDRRITDAPKRHMRIHKPYGRKKSGERERNPSNLSLLWSSSKKN